MTALEVDGTTSINEAAAVVTVVASTVDETTAAEDNMGRLETFIVLRKRASKKHYNQLAAT